MIASLVARTDFAPVPRVEIRVEDSVSFDAGGPDTTGPDSFDGGGEGAGFDAGSPSTVTVELPDGTDRVTVWRRADGRRMKVRGMVNRVYAGALGVQDVEAPFEVPSSYEVECFDGTIPLGVIPLGSVTLPRLPGGKWLTLIQQPLNPHLWAVVEDVDVNVPAISRPAAGELVRPANDVYPSLVGQGPRQGIVGAELVLAADTRDVAARVWATLDNRDDADDQLQVWLVRGNHPLLPRVFFCDTRDLREVGFDIHVGGQKTRFAASVTEIAPPAVGLVIASLSYDDLDLSFADYDLMDAAFPSYNDRDAAWDLAGASG